MSRSLRQVPAPHLAAYSDSGPSFAASKPKAANPLTAAGLKYERDLRAWLQSQNSQGATGQSAKPSKDFILHPSQWIFFEDANGEGWAQPDFILESPNYILILEAKLSATEDAWTQLKSKYIPLVALIESRRERLRSKPNALGLIVADGVRPIYGVQVCKRIRGQLSAHTVIVHSLEEALSIFRERPSAQVLFHWLPVPPPPHGVARAVARDAA